MDIFKERYTILCYREDRQDDQGVIFVAND